jgi:hypothetical protein
VASFVLCRELVDHDRAFEFVLVRDDDDYTPFVEPITGMEVHCRGICYGRRMWFTPGKRATEFERKAARYEGMIALSGLLAEAKHDRKAFGLDFIRNGGGPDFGGAWSFAECLVRRKSEAQHERAYLEILKDTGRFLNRHWGAVTAVADALRQHRRLSLDEARPIILPHLTHP